jgi:hypothetical protein
MSRLRDLGPEAARRDAVRRALPLGICGFFVTSVLAVFWGHAHPTDGSAAWWAVCGAAGAFFVALPLTMAFYRRKWIDGLLVAISCLNILFIVNLIWLWCKDFPLSAARSSMPTVFTSIILYRSLRWYYMPVPDISVHADPSRLFIEAEGRPREAGPKSVPLICMVTGGLAVLAVIFLRR